MSTNQDGNSGGSLDEVHEATSGTALLAKCARAQCGHVAYKDHRRRVAGGTLTPSVECALSSGSVPQDKI